MGFSVLWRGVAGSGWAVKGFSLRGIATSGYKEGLLPCWPVSGLWPIIGPLFKSREAKGLVRSRRRMLAHWNNESVREYLFS